MNNWSEHPPTHLGRPVEMCICKKDIRELPEGRRQVSIDARIVDSIVVLQVRKAKINQC